MPPRAQTGIDADLLQADVMRFMAIIAFCLIAILALVRNVEAPPVAVPAIEPPTLAQSPAAALRTPEPEVVPPVAQEPERQPVLKPSTHVPETIPEPTPSPALAKITTNPAPALEPIAPSPSPAPEQTVPLSKITAPAPPQEQPVQPHAAQSTASAQQTNEQEQGLSLRFQSDRDFLRLISKRDIEVFLFNDQDAQRLSHSYQFAAAKPPRQLYEVLPQTIPDAITAAARRDLGQYERYRWGIAMPTPIEQQILAFVNTAVHGELVIDRYGQVHHVE